MIFSITFIIVISGITIIGLLLWCNSRAIYKRYIPLKEILIGDFISLSQIGRLFQVKEININDTSTDVTEIKIVCSRKKDVYKGLFIDTKDIDGLEKHTNYVYLVDRNISKKNSQKRIINKLIKEKPLNVNSIKSSSNKK
jgi:hypothetical protein